MNAKQARFCLEYVIDLNATQAAIRAGYAERTAYSQGQRLLKHVEVKNEISKLQKEHAEETEITAQFVIKGIRNIAENGAREGDRLKAFELLGRHLGMWIDRKQMHAVVEQIQARPVEDAERAAFDVLNELMLEDGTDPNPESLLAADADS